MKNSNKNIFSRRQFIGTTAAAATGVIIGSQSVIGAPAIISHFNKPNSLINGVQVGAITYSYRSMPDQSAEATLQYVVDSGISAIELMGDPAEYFAGKPINPVDRRSFYQLVRKSRSEGGLTNNEKKEMEAMKAKMAAYNKEVVSWRGSISMDKFTQLKNMYKDAGVSIYAFKPSAFGRNNTDAEIDYGLRAAKALGANQVTLEFPNDINQTLKLGQMGAKHNIYIAYHGHEQQTPIMWDIALEQSKYNAMNLDLGHYIAAGTTDALQLIKAKHDYIKSMHLKDRKNPEHGKANVPWGEGDTPIVAVLQLMRDRKYKFPATAELEYQIPEGSDAVKEMVKCIDYCRKALEN